MTRKMRYVSAGSESQERLTLLLSQTGIRSEKTISALSDHLVKGVDLKTASIANGVSVSNLERDIDKVNDVAAFVVAIEELDWEKFKPVSPKSHFIGISADEGKIEVTFPGDDISSPRLSITGMAIQSHPECVEGHYVVAMESCINLFIDAIEKYRREVINIKTAKSVSFNG